jgi:hypothetical protein
MRYLIELPTAKVEAIKSLIDSGKYQDAQSFILTAIENQLYLEKQPMECFASVEAQTVQSSEETRNSSMSLSLLSRPRFEQSPNITVQDPDPEVLSAKYLWALYNRIFPVKVTLRVLLNLLRSNPTDSSYADLITVSDAAASEARKLNMVLSKIDRKSHRMHGEKLSAGLPHAGHRALERFKSHFVGTINSKGHVEGAPALLRLVNIRKDEAGHPQIGITESGFRFAIMENPILDKFDYSRVFNDEEIDFYLKHISEKLPKEYMLSMNILKAVKSGNNTPNELVRVIHEADPNISSKEAHAIRSSAVSRLSELGMLTRRREGVNVRYILSKNALGLPAIQTTN